MNTAIAASSLAEVPDSRVQHQGEHPRFSTRDSSQIPALPTAPTRHFSPTLQGQPHSPTHPIEAPTTPHYPEEPYPTHPSAPWKLLMREKERRLQKPSSHHFQQQRSLLSRCAPPTLIANDHLGTYGSAKPPMLGTTFSLSPPQRADTHTASYSWTPPTPRKGETAAHS